MKLKQLGLCFSTAAMICSLSGCNEDNTSYEYSADYSSTQVTAFSLQPNSAILNNLDSIFFSIDLVEGRIFNADSLPFGTKVDKLQVSVKTDACSTVELHFPRENKTDSIVDYLKNANDSIDFSRGPVTLHVVSYDKIVTRDYKIYVNVHQTVSDSLYWSLNNPMLLPSALDYPKYQRTVQFNGRVMTFTTDGTANASLATADTPVSQVITNTFAFPFTPALNTLTATTTTLYVLDGDGNLYSSADGTTWNACGQKWVNITAPYIDMALGIAEVDGQLMHVSYPAGATSKVDDNFPVKGNSAAIRYSTDWDINSQIVIVGGINKSNATTAATWAYDGSKWACLSKKNPMAAEGIAVFPYYCCLTDTNRWVATTKSVLIAMGGRVNADSIMHKVYMSYDLGFNWTEAPVNMQLPELLPQLYDAQVVVDTQVLTSRAVKPVTEWDTPYIYMYGGMTKDDRLSRTVYRGVVNRLQFKPLQ